MGTQEARPKPLLRAAVGDVLRRTRVSQGRTLAEVARTSRVSMPYLSELERGRKEASSEVLAAVCDGLRITLTDLLTEVRRDLLDGRTPQASVAAVIPLDAYRARRRPARQPRWHGAGELRHRGGEVRLLQAA
jgi:transcriptional regulator with XRE-family HTH domain